MPARTTTSTRPIRGSGGKAGGPAGSTSKRSVKPPPSLRPTGRKAGQTYDTLVAATRDVIVATGGLTGEAVAEQAGLATATFYAYFGTRDDALAAAFESVVSAFNAEVEPLLSIEHLLDRGLRPVLREVVSVMLTSFRKHAPVYRLGLASMVDHARMRQIWRYQEHYAAQYVQRFVRYGMAAGKIGQGDVDGTAALLLVLFQGLNNHALLRMDQSDPVISRYCDLLEHVLAP